MSLTKEFDNYLRFSIILTSIFICIFLIMAFIPLPVGPRSHTFIFFILIFGGWIGFILILISLIRTISDYKSVPSSYTTYIVGIVLIIINFAFFIFFTWVPMSVIIFVSIYFSISIAGFFLSFFFLGKAKDILENNYEAIKEEKEAKKPRIQKAGRDYRICPVCKTKMAITDQFCPECGRKI